MIKVKFKKLHPEAVVPTQGSEEAAGYDIVALEDGKGSIDACGALMTFKTGLSLEIPRGYAGFLFPRSSISSRTGYSLANSVGVIDSDYRGEIIVKFRDFNEFYGNKGYRGGDKICQLVIMPVPEVEFVESDSLEDTERGEGGFGSTDG